MKSEVLGLMKKTKLENEVFKKVCEKACAANKIRNPYETQDFLDYVSVLDGLTKSGSMGDPRLHYAFLLVSLINSWKKFRQEYVFDKDFACEILKAEFPNKLPIEVLKSAPFSEIYIQNPFSEIQGWFLIQRTHHLFVVQVLKDQPEDEMLMWGLDFKQGDSFETAISAGNFEEVDPLKDALQLYLYLCSQNSEIDEIKTVKSAGLKFRNSCTVNSVGIRIGKLLRSSTRYSSTGVSSGKTVVGHVRKAHWHHFWSGPRNGERRLVLKWVSSVLVKGGEKEAKLTRVV